MYAIRHIATGSLVISPRGQLVLRTEEEATASPIWAHYTEQPGVVEIYGPVPTGEPFKLMTMQECISWVPEPAKPEGSFELGNGALIVPPTKKKVAKP